MSLAGGGPTLVAHGSAPADTAAVNVGAPLVLTDAAGGHPTPGSLAVVKDSRVLQYAVGLTMDAAGAAWDKPGSTTLVDSGSDPDAIGSTSYYSQDATAVGTSGSWSADIGGSPTASVYVAVPVNKVDGAGPPAGSGVVETVTGHPHFLLDPFDAVPVGGTFVFIGCVLGTTAPTVTGTAGLTLVPLFDPVTIPGAVIVGWKAVLASSPTPGDQVVIDQTLDSSFAAYFRGN